MVLSTGEVLNNRYRIVRLLGQGGFGAVYRAWDTNLERPRALKENLDVSPEAQRQFKREAQILSDLTHPNLPKVIDHFILPNQGQYLVMEFVEGEDLDTMLQKADGPLPEPQVLPWIGQICDALEYLHSQIPPIIHRDIKPANIKITPQGKAMLVDFGIAKVYDPTLSTTLGARAVTPGYSPQEQYGMGTTDARTDVYALGATLYHLLTGVQPLESIQRNIKDTLVSPKKINPNISAATENSILQAIQPHPDRRFQSISEFKKALSNQPMTVNHPQTAIHAPAAPLPVSQSQPQSGQSGISGRKWYLAVAGIVTAAVLLWAIFGGGNGSKDDLAATQTALVQTLAQATEAAQKMPTQEPLPTDTPAGFEGMVLVPAGEFQMGSEDYNDERPVHTVYLDAFYIDKYEVTNARYADCVKASKCSSPGSSYFGDSGYSEHPVINIDWNQARVYCQWSGGDLPTEAQWEKAARGGLEGKKYPWGDEAPTCQEEALNGAQFSGCGGRTVEVGSFAPNGYGLFDMAGNVWEWVLDRFQSDYYSSQSTWNNPSGPSSGEHRTLRGGARNYNINGLRAADRYWELPSIHSYFIGFRCARAP